MEGSGNPNRDTKTAMEGLGNPNRYQKRQWKGQVTEMPKRPWKGQVTLTDIKKAMEGSDNRDTKKGNGRAR